MTIRSLRALAALLLGAAPAAAQGVGSGKSTLTVLLAEALVDRVRRPVGEASDR